ncbi:hypothetical protein MN608_11558 [Microdochium nivale]|nr:hypothetical protein MN608_11558 [Microdochium nivale]
MSTSGGQDYTEPAGPWQFRRYSCPASFDNLSEVFLDDVLSPISSPFRPGTPASRYSEHQDDASDASYRSARDEFDCSHLSEDGYDTDPFEGFSSVGFTISQMLEDIASSQALLDDYESVDSRTLCEDSLPAASTMDEIINEFSHPALWHNGNINFTYLDRPMPGGESTFSEESSDIFVDALTDINDDPFAGDTFDNYNYLPSTTSPHTPPLPNHHHHYNNNTSQIDPNGVDGLLDFAASAEARIIDLGDTLRLQRSEMRACVDELSARLQGVADDTHDQLVEVRAEVLRLAERVAEIEDVYRRLAGCRERADAEVAGRDLMEEKKEKRGKGKGAVSNGNDVSADEEPRQSRLGHGAEEHEQQQRDRTHRNRHARTSSLVSVDGEVLDMFHGSSLAPIPEETHRAIHGHARHRRRTSGDLARTAPSEPDDKGREEEEEEEEHDHEHPQGGNNWGYVGVMLEAYIYAGFVLAGASLVAS